MLDAKTLITAVSLISAVAGGTVVVETRYAHDEDLKAHDADLKLVSAKLDYVTNVQIEQLVTKLARLQAIRNPSPEIRNEIEDTKAELERLRKIRDQR
jgi:hypothetical protein